MEKKLVSILIPCYNAAKFLDECLTSILNQSYKNIEVIIVNDGSKDESENIIDSYINEFEKKNKRIIKINQTNQGQAAACSAGLKYVKGEFLYWQDADDVLEPNAIESLVRFLQDNKDFQIVRGKVSMRKEKSFNKIEYVGLPANPNNTNIFDEYVFEKNAYCFVGIFMVRMEHFDKRNPLRNLYISPGGQNYQLILPIAYRSKCGFIDEFVYRYRIVESSHSHSVKSQKDLMNRCDIHKDILFHVIDSINEMPKKEKMEYKLKIIIKYLRKKIVILISSNIKNIAKNLKR